MFNLKILCVAGVLVAAGGLSAVQASTLETVRARGELLCGVTTGFAGFSAPDGQGRWKGLDVDLCRAVAAAVFGDAGKFKAVPLDAQTRFRALQREHSEIDVLVRNTTATLQREAGLGLMSAGINFYDGQGFLVSKGLGVKSAKELGGRSVCVQQGTTSEAVMADWAEAHGIQYKPMTFHQFNDAVGAFSSGRCDVFTTDASGLASVRVSRLENPDNYVVLPEIISKEPLGPFVRQGDDAWLNVVKWSLHAMIAAEELGVTSANVDDMRKSSNPDIRRLLGVIEGAGRSLGLDDSWAYHIVKQVGNYGESFERNVGQGSPLKIPRGLNALWTEGGLMYALPIR